jgi:hypothetical protein
MKKNSFQPAMKTGGVIYKENIKSALDLTFTALLESLGKNCFSMSPAMYGLPAFPRTHIWET